MVLVMQNSVTLALFTDNSTILSDSMTRALSVMTVSSPLLKLERSQINWETVHRYCWRGWHSSRWHISSA